MTAPTRFAFLGALAALVVGAVVYIAAALMMPRAWEAMVHTLLFGWITGMITGVIFHTMPVFTRRAFVSRRLLVTQVGLNMVGWSCVVIGQLTTTEPVATVGFVAETVAALLLLANIVLLLRYGSPLPNGMPTPPFPRQKEMDRLGTRLTSLAALCLPLSLSLLTAVQIGWLGAAWWLAAEHLTTLGWVMLMIIGVAYHVVPRFTGQPLRQGRWATWQWVCHVGALLLMVPSLGFGWKYPFLAGAVMMAVACLLFAWGTLPALLKESVHPHFVAVGAIMTRKHP